MISILSVNQQAAAKAREGQEKKAAKDEKMEALLRKVDADFLAFLFPLETFILEQNQLARQLQQQMLTKATYGGTMLQVNFMHITVHHRVIHLY